MLENGGQRARILVVLTAAAMVVAGCEASSHQQTSAPEASATALPSPVVAPFSAEEFFLQQTGDALLGLYEESRDGWRFRSQIQAPHYHTDRDVGASSVGMGFLALAERYPNDQRWVDAARHTADWLTAVTRRDNEGRMWWPDYVDDGDVSSSAYTSFDDGTIGVGDFFWRLYEKTHDPEHKATALGAVEWTFAQAEGPGQGEYRWRWDAADSQSPYKMGMGEGAAGIIHTLATFYERTRDSDPAFAQQCKAYLEGALRYLDRARATLGRNGGDARAIPETAGGTAMNSGYLSGAAGAAFMYLKLYQVFDDARYLAKADQIFNWLGDTKAGPMVDMGDEAVAWNLMLDPKEGDNTTLATGIEEGSAGIGWTYLQAYLVTGEQKYLTVAEQAAKWLIEVAVHDTGGGLSWHEYEHPSSPVVHANLNSGAAGIGMFLEDLYLATYKSEYRDAAQGALRWIMATAQRDGGKVYWQDNDGESPYARDPSWHWGNAGIAAFIARMTGGTMDIPGQQPGLRRR